ncbi:MAG: dipeptidase [Verrucomicrobiota bacterium]|nr:dipeptidase [Verrucomicrobiota bacterium]
MDAHLEDFVSFLRFPSISTDPTNRADVAACAEWLCAKLNAIGLTAVTHPTAGHPIVVAKNQHQIGRTTVLIYGHYDVQPVDPIELWTSPPFEPRIEDDIIYARGATDNKGQILAHVLGIADQIAADGELPVNLIFVIEGEEEIGSENLQLFLKENTESLRCDVIAISDTGMVARNVPTFTYGLRGVASLQIDLIGPAMDLHSGVFGGAVANPITMLAKILATLHDANGRIAIEGFYDGVPELQPWERDAWAKLPIGDAELKNLSGVPQLFGEPGYSAIERTWARPTAEINGIGGGYQGEGTKTVIPSKAFAKLTFRLVPGQEPARVLEKVKAHLKRVCAPSVRMELSDGHTGAPFLCDPHSRWGKAAQRALRNTFGGAEPALIREGGSIPIVTTFQQTLNAEVLLLGLALPDCRVHSPNENFHLENFRTGIRLNKALIAELR